MKTFIYFGYTENKVAYIVVVFYIQQTCQPETIDSLDISPKFPGYLVFSLDT